MNLHDRASRNIARRLSFQTAAKDQAGIALDLAAGKDVPEVYHLSDAGFFDEFFYFLEEIGVMPRLLELDPKVSSRPTTVRFPAVILIYLMRIVAGLAFYWHIEPVVLHSQALMRLVGFNGREILEGTSLRGRKKPTAETSPEAADSPDGSGQSEPGSPIRGPVCADSIATYIQAIAASALERLFNTVVAVLAARSFFPKTVHATLDASEIQSTQRCEGCGMVSKEKPPTLRLRKGRIKKVLERVFGFKIWVIWEPVSGLPLALRFATIETADVTLAREVVAQALSNLGGQATLSSLAFDRGFTDGAFWWWLHQQGIHFYVPAKKNMAVYADALACAANGVRQSRQKTRSVGHGKNKTSVVDRWEAVGIDGLTSAGFYGEHGSGSHEHAANFSANPINAVVVVDDPYCRNNPGCDTMVILTNAAVAKPLCAYDRYDRRSEMENALFREAKQAWFIERPAKNTARAFRAHVYLTLLTMALSTAFRTWLEQQDKKERAGEQTGIRKYRQQVRQDNGNKVIVFDEGRYAIFEVYELVILCGRTVVRPRGVPESITTTDILRKYGAIKE
ncbi:transposase [Geoalkalibacter subterraneus]|uniref:Transposase IS4-like domain-containing protein n=1 Tax=Geoalkalibacter subterraneus TaxID=483547 RepID=A0A0B5FVM8_9BACT|nr:transposase [Geoalkalibacter subterraneus]AJF07172.1 hypothetical protein GSUB_12240 [Geoalkalibacter subterraneus]AJF07636.1 hypothetical protein GSUB_15270 [Geoalkalibacter subterraneus]